MPEPIVLTSLIDKFLTGASLTDAEKLEMLGLIGAHRLLAGTLSNVTLAGTVTFTDTQVVTGDGLSHIKPIAKSIYDELPSINMTTLYIVDQET